MPGPGAYGNKRKQLIKTLVARRPSAGMRLPARKKHKKIRMGR